ncbi:MAG: winged helix-turn-helix transcriptional regulator [Candidatus Aminicenantes bacterium]|nr:winged helix-turn-helix transcriptional regulator [Candidatus Aminicenantes bacterium]
MHNSISGCGDMLNKTEKIFKALGENNRLRIVNMLMSKPMCVCEITDIIGLSQSTVSGHLRILKEAEIIEDAKDGLWVEYSLTKKDELNKTLFELVRSMFDKDELLEKERRSALLADRNILCKK